LTGKVRKMVKKHLKRLNMPKGWGIARKSIKYIIRPFPGPHNIESSIPLGVIMRDVLKYAGTARETRKILLNRAVLVNGTKRQEPKFPVGLFDVLEIKEVKEAFRLVLNKKGKLSIIKADKSDAELLPCKIKGKNKVKGRTQINLSNGMNLLVDKDDYKTSDTLLLKMPEKDVKNKLAFAKDSTIYLTGGKHVSEVGVIQEIKPTKVIYKLGDAVFETPKEYAFVIGENKPLIKIKNESNERSQN
jgi:small subunit ribosomal protein S4e